MNSKSKIFIFSALILVLLFSYTNCGQIGLNKLDSTQTGNPGDPPNPGEGQVRSGFVAELINNLCEQQVALGIATNVSTCEELAKSDNTLAQALYPSDPGITFDQLLDSSVLELDLILRTNALQCNESILSFTPGGNFGTEDYSSSAAIETVQNLEPCQEYFISELPPASSCLIADSIQDGTNLKPWIIGDCECFQEIQTNPRDSQKSDYYVLSNNIDCTNVSAQDGGLGFIAIQNLIGSIDGNNRSINNLSSIRDGASVFSGVLAVLRNIRFSNINLITSNGTAAISNQFSRPGNDITYINNVHVLSGNIESNAPAGSAFGLISHLVGTIYDSTVTATLKANRVAGIAGEVYSIRLEHPMYVNSPPSTISVTTFTGILAGIEEMAGISLANTGLLVDVTTNITINEDAPIQNKGFYASGITNLNYAGGAILRGTSTGTIDIKRNITSNGASYAFKLGGLTAMNLQSNVANPPTIYTNAPGDIRDSVSSINMAVTATQAPTSTDPIIVNLDGLVGENLGGTYINQGNEFNGTSTFVVP